MQLNRASTPTQVGTVDDRHHKAVIQACRVLESVEDPAPLKQLAGEIGLSVGHFHRLFKRCLGITPGQYARAMRRREVQDRLGAMRTVTDAFYASGFQSPSRFYAEARSILGMSASAWRAGGDGVHIAYEIAETSLGHLLVAASEQGVCRVQFGENSASLVQALDERFPNADRTLGDTAFRETVNTVVDLIDGDRAGQGVSGRLPLDIEGTVFQEQVWQILRGIPAGRTMTYGDVAQALGRPRSHRAVANACAANPIALLIPCHRVIRTDGGLGGYRWGLERKATLLERETSAS